MAVTWDKEEIKSYLNGELQNNAKLPLSSERTFSIVPDPGKSFIGIREGMFPPVSERERTFVDDIKIYGRPLSQLEVKRQYARIADAEVKLDFPEIQIKTRGAFSKSGKLEIMADIDLSGLPEEWLELLDKNQLAGDCVFKDAAGRPSSSRLGSPLHIRQEVAVASQDPSSSGERQLELSLFAPDGRVKKAEYRFRVPDLDFVGNGIGMEPAVPSPWTPPEVTSDGSVKLWNGSCRFDRGMLPTEVVNSGESLLSSPPELVIETERGKAKVEYQMTERKTLKDHVEIKGLGKAEDFSIAFTTVVDFDGLIKADFVIDGSPVVKSMSLKWNVKPEFAEFLMTPTLAQLKDDKIELAFPEAGNWREPYMLWTTSKRKGFCWSPAHDANWVYAPKEKIISAKRGTDGALACEVRMITRPVKLPEGTQYQALFIATPSRPPPDKPRTFFLHDGSERTDGPRMHPWGSEGMILYTFAPGKDFEAWYKTRPPASTVFVGAARCSGNTDDAVSVFLKKHWEIPGDYVYNLKTRKFSPKLDDPFLNGELLDRQAQSISCCPNSGLSNDYILANIDKLLKHPCGDRALMIYYDLCVNSKCESRQHGCVFSDRFGRTIASYTTLGMRELTRLQHSSAVA